MTKLDNVWVIGESVDSYASLCAVGRRLSDRVEALVVGSADMLGTVQSSGADVVLQISAQQDMLLENAFDTVMHEACERKPDLVLFTSTKRMRLAAARLAAALQTRVVNDVSRIWMEDGCLLAEHMVFGGSAYGVEKIENCPAVVLLGEGMLASEPLDDVDITEAQVEEILVTEDSNSLVLKEVRPRQIESVNLVAARCVVSVGRGIEKEEDLLIVKDFAQTIDAELGCTRPIAEGVNWMPRERYIGVSGAMLKPDLFVAVGVSGQIQHMVGAVGAKTIVAINKDKNAPIFKHADFGVVGDWYEVVPRLTEMLKA